MPVSMYSVSIPVFMQHLNGLSGVLDKAAALSSTPDRPFKCCMKTGMETEYIETGMECDLSS